LYALQTIKVLTILFIKLTHNPINISFNLGDDYELECIYSAVCYLNCTLNISELGL
jgi:hypothetical protein